MKNLHKTSISGRTKTLILSDKILLILLVFICGTGAAVSAQRASVGKLNRWTFNKISSREKDDEILPVAYKMRVSKNKNFDRIVFEFEESEVPA